MCACLLGMPSSQENFEFTSSQIASDAIWEKLSKHFDDTYRIAKKFRGVKFSQKLIRFL